MSSVWTLASLAGKRHTDDVQVKATESLQGIALLYGIDVG